MITAIQDRSYLDFANRVLEVNFDSRFSTWITHLGECGEILAVVVYSRFSPFNCEMSVASNGSRKWFTREFGRVCYSYPFIQCGLRRITGVVEDGNDKALELNRRLGCTEEARLKCWFGDKDGIVFRMLREECKWI